MWDERERREISKRKKRVNSRWGGGRDGRKDEGQFSHFRKKANMEKSR